MGIHVYFSLCPAAGPSGQILEHIDKFSNWYIDYFGEDANLKVLELAEDLSLRGMSNPESEKQKICSRIF